MGRVTAALFFIMLGGSALAQMTVPEIFTLASQSEIAAEDVAALESQIATESDIDTSLAILLVLSRQGSLSSTARDRAVELALDISLDAASRRQALSTIGVGIALLPSETRQALMDDEIVGSLAQGLMGRPKTLNPPRPVDQRPLRDGCTLIIHGTFADGVSHSWWQRGDGFCEHLDDEVGNVWRIVESDSVFNLYPLSWPSSSPTDQALIDGGALIARHLRSLALNSPPPIDIVAHSNGGNVAVRALTALAEGGTDLHVGTLILIGTPHVTVNNQLHHWPSDPNHPLYSMCDQIVNIYAPEDTYATTVASVMAPGPIVTALEPFGLPHVVDIPVETQVGCFNAHMVLHSNAMARLIGQGLRGEITWSPDAFPLMDDPNDQGMVP